MGKGLELIAMTSAQTSSHCWAVASLKHWTKPFITSACASSSSTRAYNFFSLRIALASQARRERATISFTIFGACDRFYVRVASRALANELNKVF